MVRLLTLTTLVASVAVGTGSAALKPSISIESSKPLVVRGLAFHAREVVTVTAPVGHLRVHASVNGTFVATFRNGTDRCSGGRIVALGATGDRVVIKLPQMMCLPAASQATPG
jgi:hypothetical protein